jgi:hypothetical protein
LYEAKNQILHFANDELEFGSRSILGQQPLGRNREEDEYGAENLSVDRNDVDLPELAQLVITIQDGVRRRNDLDKRHASLSAL